MTDKPKHPGGRPTDYTLELSDLICARVAEGESMRSISRDDSMPCTTTMFRWLRESEEFKQHYEKAKEQCHTAWFEEITDIADNQVENTLLDDDGKPLLIDDKPVMIKDAVSVQHARLRIDSRKWALSKLMPKKYGDRIQNDHAVAEGVSFSMQIGPSPKNEESN